MVIVPGLEPPNGDTRSQDSPVVCTVNGVGWPLSMMENVVEAGFPSVEFRVMELGTVRQVKSMHLASAGSVAANRGIGAVVSAVFTVLSGASIPVTVAVPGCGVEYMATTPN